MSQFDPQGGSHRALSKAMRVTRVTAQFRRRLILQDAPGALEKWAIGDTD
ncbi:hypothetical protein ACIP6X_38625 [Streptomyces coeruleorubidus]